MVTFPDNSPDHPLQRAIRGTVEELAGVRAVGLDGVLDGGRP